jgi:hypothetical protein
MITSLGRHAVATATALALGCLGAVAAQRPAHADALSMPYTCTVPAMGSRAVTLDGWLTTPGQTANNRPVDFQLHIASLGLAAPIAINSWTASTWIDVSGAEMTSFRLVGSGGYVPAGQPLAGDLAGNWAPSIRGTDLLSVGAITITANTAAAGAVTAQCVPDEPRSPAASLMVVPRYHGVWAQPILPPPYGPGWHRPIVVAPPSHGGWHRPPIVVPPRGGWHRPPIVVPPHGGWHRPPIVVPPHHGGWNHVPPHRH